MAENTTPSPARLAAKAQEKKEREERDARPSAQGIAFSRLAKSIRSRGWA